MYENEILEEDLQEENHEFYKSEELENEDTTIDYTDFLQTIADNQDSIIFNQETLVYQNDAMLLKLEDTNNALRGITNIVVLGCIVVCGFWIVKNIFFKMT